MKLWIKHFNKKILAVSICVIMLAALLSGCGGSSPQTASGSSAAPEGSGNTDVAETNVETITVFLGEPEYDGSVEDEKAALNAVLDMIETLGGTDETELTLEDIIETETGTTYYSFKQAIGGLQVEGTGVKLLVNDKNQVAAVNSTIVNGYEAEPDYLWTTEAEDAEAIVQDRFRDKGLSIVPDTTDRILLPLDNYLQYVWVVYTNNPNKTEEQSYLAHYVTASGEYLYNIPVSTPGNSEARSGNISAFTFEGLEPDTLTTTVTKYKGDQMEVTVPVMKDPETGVIYLGDLERKIILADYSEYTYNDTLDVRSSKDQTWKDAELILYYNFIRVYDFYKEIGWSGPDGEETPVLLLVDYKDENGEPVNNAFYSGEERGFQVFAFNDAFADGECTDIVGHEFTHCVTESSIKGTNYSNDPGAINESMSDILGNLIEIMLDDAPEGYWLIEENGANGAVRSMKAPNDYKQPAYTWDTYYIPNVDSPGDYNDRGGVHINSSFLNYISYKLDEAGMSPEDQVYFWLNVDMMLTSATDFEVLTKILPWCLNHTGYPEYSEALSQSIEEVRLGQKEIPETVPEGKGRLFLTLPDGGAPEGYYPVIDVIDNDNVQLTYSTALESGTGIASMLLPAGSYIIEYTILSETDKNDMKTYTLLENSWTEYIEDEVQPAYFELENGETFRLDTSTLEPLLFNN